MKNFQQQYDKKTLTLEFPKILSQLKGSDSKLEIMQSTLLQPMRIDVSGNKPIQPKLFIFVNHTLKRDGLKEIVYDNADKRAKAFEMMFREVFKFKPENIHYCYNYSKKQMIEKFHELYIDAQKFESDPTHDIRDRNPIYIAWIGFVLDEAYHRYMKNFKYNNKLQTRFLLSPTGEPFGACEYMMRITQLEKS